MKNLKYVKFFGDSFNNNYPYFLSYLVYNSPTHGSAIYRKSFMIKGEGFDSSFWGREFSKFMNSINSDFESVNNILEKISWDYAIFNGFALKVVWGNDGYIKELYHIPFTDVRCGIPNEKEEIDYYVISNNWDGQLNSSLEINYKLPTFNPKYFISGFPTKVKEINGIEVNIPEPTEIQKEQTEQIIYFIKQNNESPYYPIPDYVGGLDNILTEIEANSNIKEFFKLDKELNSITITSSSETLKKWEKYKNLIERNSSLYKEIKNSIITSHLIPTILLEVNMSEWLNNRTEEMKQAFNTYQRSVIKDKQNEISSVFNSLVLWMGYYKETFNIIPFTLESDALNTN